MGLAACLLLGIAPAWAHHSFAAEFDTKRPVRLEGVITWVEWSNPHVEIFVDVKGPDVEATAWMVEAASPNALMRRGFTKTSAPQGTRVVIDGYQAKSGAPRCTGLDIILPGGQKLILSADAAGNR